MRARLFLLLLAAAPGSLLADARVAFPRTSYEILAGKEFLAPVQLNPMPEAGLFSYGLVVTVEGSGGLTGITVLAPQPTLAFDGVTGPGTRGVTATAGRYTGKGTVDMFLAAKPNHMEATLGNVSIAGLPEGTYTLRLAPYNTLGPTESVFVDGQCRAIDGTLAYGSATLTVVARPEGTVTPFGSVKLDRQTGLLIQEYDVLNTGGVAAVFRVLIRNMPAGSQVWNAHGTVDGIPYVDLPSSLAVGATQRISIEYRSQDRTTMPTPEFEVTSATPINITPEGLASALQPRATLAGGNILLEFNSTAGTSYYIQYTSDLTAPWQTALPKVDGTGNRIQWIDNGPPKTATHPSANPTRFYRIVVAEPAR